MSPIKTLEISSELDKINVQFEESLSEFSRRYQNSTVALTYLLKKNQEFHRTLTSKEEEIEYLKNERWEAENKIQNFKSDLEDIIGQQQEPLEDLIIVREKENKEISISAAGYQKENDKS